MKILSTLISLNMLLFLPALAEFTHPGVAHSQESIDFVKTKIAAKEEPWFTAWQQLNTTSHASLKWKPEPRAIVERGPYNNPDIGSSEYSSQKMKLT